MWSKGKNEECEKRAVNNGKSPLMAHKLSCLTTHFAQLPIHHANTKCRHTFIANAC